MERKKLYFVLTPLCWENAVNIDSNIDLPSEQFSSTFTPKLSIRLRAALRSGTDIPTWPLNTKNIDNIVC